MQPFDIFVSVSLVGLIVLTILVPAWLFLCPPMSLTSSGRLIILTGIGSASSLLVFSVLLIYLRGHDSNHTGFEPWELSLFFVPTAILGFVTFRRRLLRWGALFALFLGTGGILLLAYIDYFNVLVQYDRWLRRGMP